jgi:hypothetical protein
MRREMIETDVSGLRVLPIFKAQTLKEEVSLQFILCVRFFSPLKLF